MNTKPYRLRLISDHAIYDIAGSNLWREWRKGAIVTDQTEIELLESHAAPVERIIEP
jgi:hypothetical protein